MRSEVKDARASDTAPKDRAPLLEIQNLTVGFHTSRGQLDVLHDFSLNIGAGESFGLVGESGCGKSTLLMAIMRYLGPTGVISGGSILFEGHDLVRANETALARVRGSRIAVVYQEPASALNPSMTIGRQLIEVPMLHQGMSRRAALGRAAEVLADVNMPDSGSILRRYPHQLSGGQKQRVVIAMALLTNPTLLLLDEPTTGLDVTVEATILDLIDELRHKYHTALLYISHNLGLIARVSERIGVMYAGRLVEDAPAAALFATPRHPYTRGLLRAIPRMGTSKHDSPLVAIPGAVPPPGAKQRGCSFMARCPLAMPGRCDIAEIALVETEPRHHVRCLRWDAEALPPRAADAVEATASVSETLIEAQELSRVYRLPHGVLKANDGLDLAARRGEVLGIVGESGSGKSTFARVLAGLEAASGGALRFSGVDLARRTIHHRTAEQVAAIQMVFQNPDGTLNPSFPVGWPIARALRKFGLGRRRREIDERVRGLLEMVRLPASARHSLPRQLSGGQKQRIAIARAFAGQPEVLIADEPTSALDVSVQATVVNLLLSIQARNGTTMVFISHDLSLVRYIADHVVVMYLGRVMETGPTEALYSPPFHPYTEALLSAVPTADPERPGERIRLEGELPSPINPPSGCRFASRCPRKLGSICDRVAPPAQDAGNGHLIFCHIPLEELAATAANTAVAPHSSAPHRDETSRATP